jgi:hypothetical protein
MRVDLQALAQHYGLKTHFVDISSELVIAAFFATHEFRAGDFYPITQGYGYIKIISFMPFLGDSLDKNFQMIGLQPFLRPGLQCAFALKPNLDGTNHYHIRTIKFKQTYFCKVLGWIFRSQQKIEDQNKKSYTDHNILFPKEEICVPAELIRNSNSVTKTNLIKYCEENMLNIDQLQHEFCTSGIKITEEPLYSLSPRRQDELFREYEGRPYGDAMLSPPRLIG